MSFIEKQRHGNHEYYYLVKNVRISPEKVKKYRIFLGRTIPEDEVLRKYMLTLEKKALSEKFESKWLPPSTVERVDDFIAANLINNIRPESYQPKDFLVRFTYNTNAIEGSRLSLRQTALILVDKVTPEGANAKDVIEALNSADAWQYVNARKGGLTTSFLKRIQLEVTKNTPCRIKGDFRDTIVLIAGSEHVPPSAEEVPVLVEKLILEYHQMKNSLHPIELAAYMHNRIVNIHPFTDGNGRTARLILNWVLLRNKLPPVVIESSIKEKYYRAIEEGDIGNHAAFSIFLAETLLLQYALKK